MPSSVLVVDDDPNLVRLMSKFLTLEGFAPVPASNGAEALSYLRGGGAASVILLDLRMPVMDGWEFARRYAELPSEHVPIIAFVAALNAEQECAMLSTASIVTKPFDLDDLLAAVRDQLPVAT